MSKALDADFLALQEALVGRYSLEREIGRGGMGIVYLAHEVALDRPVALKLLPPAYAAQPTLRERFLREARTAAKLSHPNIVPIHTVDEVGDFVYFAMAYIDGPTLGERVRTRGPLSDREAVRVLREVAWALAYAHAEGVIHRDVKPDNILLERGSGRALVTDFGIAHVAVEAGVTRSGEVLGTAEYMSPEQASGEDIDARSDLYSLGVVGYYAVTGRLPFEGQTMAAVLAKHLTQPAPPVASVAPETSTGVASAIDRCLKKAREERFPDGAALAEALGASHADAHELPVPLRVYIKNMRALVASLPMLIIMWVALGVITLLGAAEDWPRWLMWVLGTVSAAGPPLGLLVHARKLLAAGYGVDDARLAVRQDVEQRREEIGFQFGDRMTGIDRWLRGGMWSGWAAFAGAWAFQLLGVPGDWWAWSALPGAAATWLGLAWAWRGSNRRDSVGEGLLGALSGRMGDLLFKLGGIGVKRRALAAGGAHRPTEMAIGIAADRLFESLPRELRRDLKGLPETIAKLERDAKRMRRQVEELDAVLAEVRDRPADGGGYERARLRAQVEETRDEAKNRMTEAVSVLETIRLGLLRLHAGDGTVESVTVSLGSARELSAHIELLLAGQQEVRRILDEPEPRSADTPTPDLTPVP